jgi:hypothetical protein
MSRILATVVASSGVLITFALPAVASSAQSTTIDGFASSVSTVAYQQPVVFTGELVESLTKNPVPNEPIQIQIQPPGGTMSVPVAAGTTEADGHFTITTTLPSGGSVSAVFAGDTELAPSHSSPAWGISLRAEHLPSRLMVDPVPASVPAGKPVTFSGTMQVQVNGTWQPFQDAPLTLTMEPDTSSQPNLRYPTTSGAAGRFSLTEPVSQTSAWSVDTTLNGTYFEGWFPTYSSASYSWIDGVSTTRVADFALPARDEAHHAYYSGMYATGTIERWNGGSWVGLPFGWADFYYRPKGSTTWHKDNSAQTDAYGHFRNIVGVHLGTADWQARVRASADTVASTSTNTVTNTITDSTHFASATIHRGSSGSSITGQVTDWTGGQISFSSLNGLKINLYYRSKSSTTWHAYRTTTTGRNGAFHFSVTKNHGYNFKVVLPAQGPYQTSTSRTL